LWKFKGGRLIKASGLPAVDLEYFFFGWKLLNLLKFY